MSNEFLGLLDITARRGTDQAVGTVEEVITYAPEMERILGRPIPGTHYTARVRTAYTANAAFRKANQGSPLAASQFTQKRFDAFFFDTQLQVDEAVARAAEQEGDSLASLQSDEAIGALRAKAIAFGKQFYQGTLNDANGFPGLIDFLTSQASVTDPITNAAVDQTVDAAGTSTGCERVWMVWNHLQGVHFLFGGNQGIDIKPWTLQQVVDPNDSTKRLMAWVSNLSGFIGLSMAHVRAVGCIKNVKCGRDGSGAKPVTDKLIAQLEAKFPVGMQPNGGGAGGYPAPAAGQAGVATPAGQWLCFMSRGARASLQQSRTVSLLANMGMDTNKLSGAAGIIAPLPTHTASGVPIIVTDSIPQETAS